MRGRLAAGLVAAAALVPRVASACAACLSSAYGDRSYNLAYVGLLLMPFAVATVIGGVLAWRAGYRLHLGHLRRARFVRKVTLKETT